MSAESSYIICGSSFLFKLNKVIMKEKKFKIGDRVRIRPDSRFAHQCSEPGVVVVSSDSSTSFGEWIKVQFDNDYQNSYPREDLYFDEPSADQEFHVGDMIEITQGSNHWVSEMDKYVGRIATITKVEPGSVVDQIYRIDIDNGEWKWIPQAGHFINAPQHGLDQKDELLYRAEQMFPVGTRFYPAHVSFDKEDSEYCVMTDDSVIAFGPDGNIYASIHDGNNWDHLGESKYGNTRLNRVLYYKPENRWATVVKEAPQFKVGDKVMITESKDNWCPEMDEFIGKIATLTKARGSKGTHFSIDLDNDEWAWSDKDGHFRKPTEDELSDDPTPIKFKYKPGDTVTLTETCHGVGPQEVTIRDYSESHGKPAYTLHTWVGRFPEDILSPIEESKPILKFKVGDFVVANSKANGRYVITKEGWTGKVTEVEDRNGSTFISVQGKYNKDNSKFVDLDAHYFDLTTEDECTPRVVSTATTTPAFYSLQEEFDKVTVSMSDITQVYTDSTGRIRHEWSTSTPVVEELPTLRVKKVSFNRI